MDTQQYKIGIVGLGPVGMILAVHFKHAGCKVAICDVEKEKINFIQKEGIKLTGAIEKTSFFDDVHMSCQGLLNDGVDLLISCVKTYRVDELIKVISKF